MNVVKPAIASAAMIAVGAMASAEGVSVTASANMGLKFKEQEDPAVQDLSFHHEFDVTFAASSMTDTGLEFGGSMTLDNNEGASGKEDEKDPKKFSGTVANEASVYISGAFGKISIGDIAAGDEVGGIKDVGFDGIGADDQAETLRGKTKHPVRYEGTFGQITLSGSLDGDDDWGLGVKVAMEGFGGGVGYASDKTLTVVGGGSFGSISGNVLFSSRGDDPGAGVMNSKKAIGADISFDAGGGTSITAAYSQSKENGMEAVKGVGIGVSYVLGGGATLMAGVGEHKEQAVGDIGISMKF